MTRLKSATWTRPGTDPWWLPNPLAVGTFCPTCQTRLARNRTTGRHYDCPICEDQP